MFFKVIESKLATRIRKPVVTLHDAFFYGTIEQAVRILNAGADIHAKEYSWSVLHYAALRDNPAFVQILLDRGFDPNIRDETNFSPLHIAAFMGHIKTMDALIEGGADIRAIEEHGHTPLHLAAIKSRTKAVAFLLSKGASLEAKDYSGRTASFYANQQGSTTVMEILDKSRKILEKYENQTFPAHEFLEKLGHMTNQVVGLDMINTEQSARV